MATKRTYRVSVKGILIRRRQVLLVRKPNRTWDLPGGNLETGETSESCLQREFFEETGIAVEPTAFAGAWVRARRKKPDVFTLAFLCKANGGSADVTLSDEHTDSGYFPAEKIAHLQMVHRCRETVLAQLA